MQKTKKFSIKEIAKLAGCSTSTVSNVLNEKGFFGEEIKKKVLSVCADLDYTPNALARNLRIGKTETIGLIFSRTSADIFRSVFYLEMIDHLQAALAKRRYDLLLSEFKIPPKDEPARLPRVVSQGKVDALLVLGGMPRSLLNSLAKTNLNILLLDSFHENLDSINSDGYGATYKMTAKLAELGHKSVSYYGFAYEDHNIHMRIKGFEAAVKDFKLRGKVHAAHLSKDEMCRDFEAEMKSNPPTGILAVNDELAFALVSRAKSIGINVPEDLSVFGFDNTSFSTMAAPYISTAAVDIAGMAELGAKMITDRIKNSPFENNQISLPAEIIMRASTAKRGK